MTTPPEAPRYYILLLRLFDQVDCYIFSGFNCQNCSRNRLASEYTKY